MLRQARVPKWLAVLSIQLTTLLSPGLSASPLDGPKLLEPNPMTDWVIARVRSAMIDRLDLTTSQIRAIHDLVEPRRAELWAEVTAVKETRMALLERIGAVDADVASIQQAHAAAAAAELEMVLSTTALLGELRQILRPDQLEEASLMANEWRRAADLRFADLAEKFANGELLGKKWRRRVTGTEAD